MITYPIVDLQGDSYLNPVGQAYSDGSGTHQRNVNTIKSISIHHDASRRPHAYDSVARYRSEAAEHYKRLGPGLQYHYKIDNQGTIFKIRPHSTWLYAVGSSENVSMLAICLDGYFHPPYSEQPTREQYEALGQLLITLCEQTPSIPAVYKDVRPHRDYSATACCGDVLCPWVFAINSKADVLAIPSSAVYDYPELQPSVPKPTPPPSVPVDNRPEWEKNFKKYEPTQKWWSEGQATIVDLSTNQTIGTLPDNKDVEFGGETKVGGTEFFISQYWVSRGVYNKVLPKAQFKDTADIIPTPETPTTPPPPEVIDDHGEEILSIVKQILALLTKMWEAFIKLIPGLNK